MNILWLFATGGGALLLGMAIAWAMMRQRRLTAAEKGAQNAEVRREYRERDPE